ncbi:protein Shroom2-like [Clavelina lepadiformis]|uniref:ASD2 domain-containing protein n=1 Tax=Clavelina lepadiformis TaxID=159417 RepID=A0ABP0H0U0_CLALP
MAPKLSCELIYSRPSSPDITSPQCELPTRRRRYRKRKQTKSCEFLPTPTAFATTNCNFDEDKIHAKINMALNLRLQTDELKILKDLVDIEMEQNEGLGNQLHNIVKKACNEKEVEKYNTFVKDSDKVINLLLSVSQRLSRVENEIKKLPCDAEKEELVSLCRKRRRLSGQYNDAKDLKENHDRRQRTVSEILTSCLTSKQYANFELYMKMKSALIAEQRELEEQCRRGEKQIENLRDSLPEELQIKLDKMLDE